MTFESFCIVRSPIDSVRVSFGEALAGSFDVVFNESKEEAEATFVEVADFSEVFSSLNELDFFKLEATSLLNAPNSWAKFLTTRDSGLGFNTEVKDEDIEVTVEVIASLMASSPSSSGMVGWLKDCLGCFLNKTDGACSTNDTTSAEVNEAGEVCKALEGKGLTSVRVGIEVV
jgi:hypothetical protein